MFIDTDVKWFSIHHIVVVFGFFSVPGRKNFYISPLKESPFKSPPSPSQLTPNTRQLYSFGEGFGVCQFLNSK